MANGGDQQYQAERVAPATSESLPANADAATRAARSQLTDTSRPPGGTGVDKNPGVDPRSGRVDLRDVVTGAAADNPRERGTASPKESTSRAARSDLRLSGLTKAPPTGDRTAGSAGDGAPSDPFETVVLPEGAPVRPSTQPEHTRLAPDDADHFATDGRYYQTPPGDLHLVSSIFSSNGHLGLTVPTINGVAVMRDRAPAAHNVEQVRLGLRPPSIDTRHTSPHGHAPEFRFLEPGRNVVSAMTLLPPTHDSVGTVTARTAREVLTREIGPERVQRIGLPDHGDVRVIVRGVTNEMRERIAWHENRHVNDVRTDTRAWLGTFNSAVRELAREGRVFHTRDEMNAALIDRAGLANVRPPAHLDARDPLNRLATVLVRDVGLSGASLEVADARTAVDGVGDAHYDGRSNTLTVTLCQVRDYEGHPLP